MLFQATADKENLQLEKQNQITENNELKTHIEKKSQEFVALETKLNETIEVKSREVSELEAKIAENQEKFVVRKKDILINDFTELSC